MADNVVPFDRGRRRKAEPPSPPPLPPTHQGLHSKTRQAAPAARELAAQQAAADRRQYERARSRQEKERLLREGIPVPARITMALDVRGLYGPEVDTACGAAEPAVDMWECGVEVPTPENVKLLAELTGFPIPWFYKPIAPGPLFESMWICGRGKRGCHSPEPDYVDERGVLHYGGEPPRTPPASFQGALF